MNNVLAYDRMLGPSAPGLGWVPAPRYLMRRARIQALMRGVPRGRLLEIGPGAGALLLENAQLGFQCEALETSEEARQMVARLVCESGRSIPLHPAPGEWAGRFEVVCAFEVLEHIEDDRSALAQWSSWLKPGGHILLSVPAHMKLWTARDEWAGHVRRYERDQFRDVVDRAGLEIEAFECYGFPLTNLSEWASSPLFARNIRRDAADAAANRKLNNDRSGIDRSPDLKLFPLVSSLPGKMALRTFFAVQDLFLRTDLGSGYIVKARRS